MIWQLLRDAFRRVQPSSRFAAIDTVDELDERLAAAGRAAVAEAERLFDLDVFDPRADDTSARADASRKVISGIVRAAGWAFALPYLGNKKGATQWCGMFAAACWRAAGIEPSMLATFWASTIRLYNWGRYKAWNKTPNSKPAHGPYRLMAKLSAAKPLSFEPRAGDILVIGDGDPSAGDHICLVVSYDADRRVFITIEGNGRGLGPDGKTREGIVRGERPMISAMWLYRPAPGDVVA